MLDEIELRITYKCNWNCDYCAVDTHNKHRVSQSYIYQCIDDMNSNSIVTISGGEPGLCTRKYIKTIIDMLLSKDCIIKLNTNGLFLEKFPDLLCHFDEIFYHCSSDLQPIPVKRYNHKNIHYLLIITDNNIHRLKEYVSINNFKFLIVASSNPGDINKEIPVLNKHNKKLLIKKYNKNMTTLSKSYWLKSKDESCIIYL